MSRSNAPPGGQGAGRSNDPADGHSRTDFVTTGPSADNGPLSPPIVQNTALLNTSTILQDLAKLSAPGCSEIAVKYQKGFAALREFGAFSVTLPPDGDGWVSGKSWPSRKRLNHIFDRFRESVQFRQWDKVFDDKKECGAQSTKTIQDLYDDLRNTAPSKFANCIALDDKVATYMKPRIGSTLNAVAKALRFNQLRADDGIALTEGDYRKIFDQFLDDILNDVPNMRTSLDERTLNFSRNKIYDDLPLEGPATGAIQSHVDRLDQASIYNTYLTEAVDYYAGKTGLEESSLTATTTKIKAGQRAMQVVDEDVNGKRDTWRIKLFYAHLAHLKAQETDDADFWNQLKLTRAARQRLIPRAGTCDALNSIHLRVPVPSNSKEDAVTMAVRGCCLVRITDEDMKATAKKDTPEDHSGYRGCPQLKRTMTIANPTDLMGFAALYTNMVLQFAKKHSRLGVKKPVVPTVPTVPLLIPVVLYEYKRSLGSHDSKGLIQLRLYLNATCLFLEKLGITEFMIFGVLTEGTEVMVIGAWRESRNGPFGVTNPMTWIVEQYTTVYDISKPEDAFQLACFLVWVKLVHMPLLEGLLTQQDVVRNFAFYAERGDLDWTVNHQIPKKKK